MKYVFRKNMLEPLISNNVSRYDIKDIEKCAESGLSEFQRLYAESYLHGIGVSKDPVKAYKWLCKATEEMVKDKECSCPWRGNDIRAIALKGVLEYYGIGAEQDKPSGMSNLEKAADYGDTLAILNLAIILYNEDKRRIAVKQLEQLAQRFVSNVKFEPFEAELYVFTHRMLAQCYIKGKGVKKSYHLAYMHWLLAAEVGDVDAIFNVALCYEQGIGVDKNDKMAFRYFNLASRKYDVEGTIKLGDCYAHGIGVRKNSRKAMQCYNDAYMLSLNAI